MDIVEITQEIFLQIELVQWNRIEAAISFRKATMSLPLHTNRYYFMLCFINYPLNGDEITISIQRIFS